MHRRGGNLWLNRKNLLGKVPIMPRNMSKWFAWQVGAPLLGPALLSAVVIFFWWTLDDSFTFRWKAILEDLTPWALNFYVLTLVGATMDDFLAKWGDHKVLGWSMVGVGGAAALYSAILVVWRIIGHSAPGTVVYVVTFILLVISIGLCYRGAQLS